jgi:adenylate cyclase
VLVGSTVPEDHDLFPVAIARGGQAGDNLMYGVEIHANVIESILRGNFIFRESPFADMLLVMLLTLGTFLITSALKEVKTKHTFVIELNGFLFVLALLFFIGYAALYLFNTHNFLLAVISPVLAVLGGYVASTVYHFVLERKQRLLIKTMFSTYVNPTVVDELLKDPEKLTLGGERKELSVLFSDIEAFTTFAERMPSQQLVELLNDYLSAMTEIVFRNNGTLDKYEGDALMAFWGAPIPQTDHALRACRTALEMQQALVAIRTSWHEMGRPAVNVRVGINTGEMTVGNMGGQRRFDYTVIGDSVNLASRLEGANKTYKTCIMVGERTYELVRHVILGRELDLITVKGRSEPIKIYELLQEQNGPLSPELAQFLAIYSAALELYHERAWTAAKQNFEEALRYRPGDYTTQIYIERTTLYETAPPPPDWDGVFLMATK